ncbi:MAG: hypothetical protein IJV31_10215 [Clostridia bacterium]|nr:hypothetical protein [Clostridia bacterium]
MENVRYKKAFKEVYIIINSLDEDMYVKIPISFIKTIKENMDKDYHITVKELNDTKMQETIDIMALVYRDYLCDEQTRLKLIEEERKTIEDKYGDVFKNKTQNHKSEDQSIKSLVEIRQEKWYKMIWNKIKRIWSKR